jgi:hypothetical protein
MKIDNNTLQSQITSELFLEEFVELSSDELNNFIDDLLNESPELISKAHYTLSQLGNTFLNDDDELSGFSLN